MTLIGCWCFSVTPTQIGLLRVARAIDQSTRVFIFRVGNVCHTSGLIRDTWECLALYRTVGMYVTCLALYGTVFLTRLPSRTTSSRWQVNKEAIGLSRVQQFSHLCVARPYQISVNSIVKHIHTTSINTIIWQFVSFIYHPL